MSSLPPTRVIKRNSQLNSNNVPLVSLVHLALRFFLGDTLLLLRAITAAAAAAARRGLFLASVLRHLGSILDWRLFLPSIGIRRPVFVLPLTTGLRRLHKALPTASFAHGE